jgi:protein-tyrosine-phosphatase
MNKIIVLCKYNQARSITAAAALRRFFPDYEILSAGIIGNPRIPIPSSILQILDEWGLHERDERSTSTTDLPPISSTDLVLCADQEVRGVFTQQHNLDPASFPNVCLLEDFARGSLEVPIDPVALGEAETKNQLARSLVLAIRGTNKFLEIETSIKAGHLPADKNDHLEIQKRLIENRQEMALSIDVGFSIPDINIWSPDLNMQKINPSKFEEIENPLEANTVLISKFEVDKTSELLLSIGYSVWLKKLSSNFDLTVVSQPFDGLPQNRRHEAILGMIHS